MNSVAHPPCATEFQNGAPLMSIFVLVFIFQWLVEPTYHHFNKSKAVVHQAMVTSAACETAHHGAFCGISLHPHQHGTSMAKSLLLSIDTSVKRNQKILYMFSETIEEAAHSSFVIASASSQIFFCLSQFVWCCWSVAYISTNKFCASILIGGLSLIKLSLTQFVHTKNNSC
jgi:hypothetical protein